MDMDRNLYMRSRSISTAMTSRKRRIIYDSAKIIVRLALRSVLERSLLFLSTNRMFNLFQGYIQMQIFWIKKKSFDEFKKHTRAKSIIKGFSSMILAKKKSIRLKENRSQIKMIISSITICSAVRRKIAYKKYANLKLCCQIQKKIKAEKEHCCTLIQKSLRRFLVKTQIETLRRDERIKLQSIMLIQKRIREYLSKIVKHNLLARANDKKVLQQRVQYKCIESGEIIMHKKSSLLQKWWKRFHNLKDNKTFCNGHIEFNNEVRETNDIKESQPVIKMNQEEKEVITEISQEDLSYDAKQEGTSDHLSLTISRDNHDLCVCVCESPHGIDEERNKNSLNSNVALNRWDNFIKGFRRKNTNATLLAVTFRRFWMRYQQKRIFSATRIQTYIRTYLAKKRCRILEGTIDDALIHLLYHDVIDYDQGISQDLLPNFMIPNEIHVSGASDAHTFCHTLPDWVYLLKDSEFNTQSIQCQFKTKRPSLKI